MYYMHIPLYHKKKTTFTGRVEPSAQVKGLFIKGKRATKSPYNRRMSTGRVSFIVLSNGGSNDRKHTDYKQGAYGALRRPTRCYAFQVGHIMFCVLCCSKYFPWSVLYCYIILLYITVWINYKHFFDFSPLKNIYFCLK